VLIEKIKHVERGKKVDDLLSNIKACGAHGIKTRKKLRRF